MPMANLKQSLSLTGQGMSTPRPMMKTGASSCQQGSHPGPAPHQNVLLDRRSTLTLLLGASTVLTARPAQAILCPGLNGYALSKCLKEAREAREASEGVEDERLKSRQYEQPGTLVTLPSGIQYREIDKGSTGPEAELGSILELQYTVYRLSSGAYFKYSSGGTPVLLWAVGSGFEGRDDLDDVYRFRLGDPNSLPRAATPAIVGMRAGGCRRVLIPPQAGWTNDQVQPQPPSFGGQRRLAAHRDEPLLLEVRVQRVYASNGANSAPDASRAAGKPYALPAPPSPFQSLLPEKPV